MQSKVQQTEADQPIVPPTNSGDGSDVQLAPYIAQVLRGKKTIGKFLLVGIILGAILAKLLPARYTAEAALLPPGGGNSAALALASQLGALGSSGLLGVSKTPADLYSGIMRSHTVLGAVVQRFKLEDVYHVRKQIDAERILDRAASIEIDPKSTIIKLTVTDKNPVRARDLVQGILDELQNANENLAVTESSQRRLFFEKQLEREKEALANAEVELKKSQEQTGLILPAGQAALQLDTISKVKAEIAGRQVELASLRDSATDQNPEVIRIRSEISNLEGQLGSLQNGKTNDGNVPTAQVPELALENIRKQRDVKYHEALFDILARQYESVRIDESKNGPTLQVLDHPTVPEEKSGPPRTLVAIAIMLLAGFVGFLWVLFSANRSRLKTWSLQFTETQF